MLFCAVRGPRCSTRRHDYAADAFRRGASGLLVERWLPLDVPQLLVPWTRAAVGAIAAALHGEPAARMSVVGVTGTDGKTTTAALTQAALTAGGRSTAVIGTVAHIVHDDDDDGRPAGRPS